ncbi:hypothetical protein BJX70DRAFT_392476 [Aspergillus crustosus]
MGLPRKPLTTPRKGCTECKRRHIKCDESQPRCGNCNISFRHCSYEELISKARAFIPPSQGSSSRSIITPAAKACPQDDNRGSAGDSPPLNKLHLELFHHFVTNILTFFGLDSVSSLELVKIILGAPYLMNEIIGFAALNLSIIRLLQQTFYRHHAVQLQTHALTEFNGANLVITPDTCLLMFLFSSILAMHMLCDKLRFLEGTFDTFLDDFIQSLRLHRCIRAVTSDSWPVLLQSPLKALLETENKALSNDGVTGKESPVSAVGPINSWPVIIPPGNIDLLSERKPEALVILAHFGALLHLHREMWVFGDSGKYVVASVREYLGVEWKEWLRWSCEVA